MIPFVGGALVWLALFVVLGGTAALYLVAGLAIVLVSIGLLSTAMAYVERIAPHRSALVRASRAPQRMRGGYLR